MVDHEKLIDVTTKGLACLCFRNDQRLSMLEITELFSKYGDVVGVNCAGGENGHRFVRYHTKEEALRCVIDLEGNRSVKLVPVIHRKNQNQSNYEHASNKQTNFHERKNDQSPSGSQSSKNSRTNNKPKQNNGNKNQDGYNSGDDLKNNGNGGTSKEQFSRFDLNSMRQNFNVKTAENFTRSNGSGDQTGNTPSATDSNEDKLQELHKLRGVNSNTFKPSGVSTSDLPAGLPSPIIPSSPRSELSSQDQAVMADIPRLVAPACRPNSDNRERVRVIYATEVIVANLGANVTVDNVYSLLKRFHPIYISEIGTVPDIDVRFCHVYFAEPTTALQAEQHFDRARFQGNDLIALTSHRLEAETGIL